MVGEYKSPLAGLHDSLKHLTRLPYETPRIACCSGFPSRRPASAHRCGGRSVRLSSGDEGEAGRRLFWHQGRRSLSRSRKRRLGATKKWIEAQNKLTFDYLAAIPERKEINAKLTALWNYEKYSVPFREGGRYFFSKNTGLQNQSVLFTGAEPCREKRRPCSIPIRFRKTAPSRLSGYDVTDDGKLIAYGLAAAGSDWQEWKVRDIETGKDLSDDVQWVKFSGASWKKDGSGFFYSRYDAPASADQLKQTNYFHKLYFHKLGTTAVQGRAGLRAEGPQGLELQRRSHARMDDSLSSMFRRGPIRRIESSTRTSEDPDSTIVELLNKQDASYDFVGSEGNTLLVSDRSGRAARPDRRDRHSRSRTTSRRSCRKPPKTRRR